MIFFILNLTEIRKENDAHYKPELGNRNKIKMRIAKTTTALVSVRP